MAPAATTLYLAVVLALVVWRRRWAWRVLVILYGSSLVMWAFEPHRFAATHLLGLALGVVKLALLVSAPMRRRLQPPVVARSVSSLRTNAG
jgi:hypothetical protein